MLVELVFVLAQAARPAPVKPTPSTPSGPAKIQRADTILFESVEAAADCVAAHTAWEDYYRQSKARQEAIKAAEVKCAGKPYDQVKLSELAAWKEARAKCAGEIADAEGIKGAPRPNVSPREACAAATTATLSKGIEVTVLAKDPAKPMLKVKVETGRSTGMAGWITASALEPEPKTP